MHWLNKFWIDLWDRNPIVAAMTWIMCVAAGVVVFLATGMRIR
jgi:hypothetical protein